MLVSLGPDVQHWDDSNWEGYSGPKQCFPSARVPGKAPYSTTRSVVSNGHGSPGGVTTIGGRSFTIWSWVPGATALTRVYDSGSEFEMQQSKINNDLCTGCDTNSTCVARFACSPRLALAACFPCLLLALLSR